MANNPEEGQGSQRAVVKVMMMMVMMMIFYKTWESPSPTIIWSSTNSCSDSFKETKLKVGVIFDEK
jgi:hypothetical protein